VILSRATVTQASPLLVRLDGAATASSATRLASYTPTLSHRVLVVQLGTGLVVLGQEV
jgi:hypothetical protein